MCVLSCSVVSDSFVTPWTVACQAPLSMGLFRQEYWNGLPFPPPENLPDPGIEPVSLESLTLVGRFFATVPPGKTTTEAQYHIYWVSNDTLQSYHISWAFSLRSFHTFSSLLIQLKPLPTSLISRVESSKLTENIEVIKWEHLKTLTNSITQTHAPVTIGCLFPFMMEELSELLFRSFSWPVH